MIGTREGTPVRNFVLEDLTLDGMYIDQGNSGGSCIIFSHNQNTVHKNIIIRRVEAKNSRAGFNSRNIIGSSWDDYGLIIEDCIFTHSSTGMTFANTAWVIIRNNRIEYTSIDAILPDSTSAYLGGGGDGACHHFIVEYNYCKDVGDTGIDFTAHTARGDARHSDMTARFNILVTARVRISGTDGAVFSDNVIYNKDPLPSGFPSNAGLYREGISCDAGESGSTNVEVSRNKVQPGVGRGSDRSIRFEETRNLVCRDNVIYGEGAWDITYYSVSGTQSIGGNQKTSGDMPAEYYE
jgi:hypothetical protein